MENVENTSDPINASTRHPQPKNEGEKRNKKSVALVLESEMQLMNLRAVPL